MGRGKVEREPGALIWGARLEQAVEVSGRNKLFFLSFFCQELHEM